MKSSISCGESDEGLSGETFIFPLLPVSAILNFRIPRCSDEPSVQARIPHQGSVYLEGSIRLYKQKLYPIFGGEPPFFLLLLWACKLVTQEQQQHEAEPHRVSPFVNRRRLRLNFGTEK